MGLEERGVEANCVCIASACLHLFAWGAPAVACLALLDLYFFQQSQRRLNRFNERSLHLWIRVSEIHLSVHDIRCR